MPRLRPPSLPLASKVANAGSSPVRTLEFQASPAVVFSFVTTQNAFTFPAREDDQPLHICIVRPCAAAVALTAVTRPNNNSVRRFIRESLLGSRPAQSLRACPAERRSHGAPRTGAATSCSLQQCSSGFSPARRTDGKSGIHLLVRERVRSCCLRRGAFRTGPHRHLLGTPRSRRLGPARRSGRQGRRVKGVRDLEANPHPGRPVARNPAKY